jgi:hypothetical protein
MTKDSSNLFNQLWMVKPFQGYGIIFLIPCGLSPSVIQIIPIPDFNEKKPDPDEHRDKYE